MKTVLQSKDNVFNLVLYMAFELSAKKWKLAFGNGKRTRMKTIAAGDWTALPAEIERAKSKLNCPADAHVVSCYEAGRDGFWIHRALQAEGIESHVVDSASIEVSRRKKQAKTDRIDAGALLRLLVRYCNGDKAALHTVRGSSRCWLPTASAWPGCRSCRSCYRRPRRQSPATPCRRT